METVRTGRAFGQYKKLYEENLISKEEYLKAQEDNGLAMRKFDLISERIYQDSIYRAVQVDQMEDGLYSMQENLRLVRQRKENLNVRS